MSITTPSNIPKLAARLAKIHVLVVDDDAEIQGLVRSMLRELGFENVTTATDGTEAIRILKRNQRKQEVDLVIADWQMKPLDGLELLKYIRTSAESPNRYLPFIMLTGKGEKQDVEKARDQGFNEYLIKPFTAKALCDRITLCVDQPREFVTTPQYTGPSRRRRGKELPEGVSEDRRRRDSGNRLTGKALKGKIGFEITMKQIFTPQIIAAAQSVADDRQAAFLERVKREMAELFHIYRNAAQVEDPKKYYGK
ncbi:MAG: response regulator, partial [Rickettsiales bacterium]